MELYHVMLAVTAATASASLALGVLAWRQRPEPGATWLAISMFASTWWKTTIGVRLGAENLRELLLWIELGWIGVAVLPVAWLLFALEYTGRTDDVSRRAVAGGVAFAGVIVATVRANPAGLVRSDVSYRTYVGISYLVQSYEPLFWISVFALQIVGLVGAALLLSLAINSQSLYRGQASALTGAALAPQIGAAASLAGAAPHPALNPIPFSFTVSGVLCLWAVSQHRLLDRVPVPRRVARDIVVDRMDDGVVVVDGRGEIVDVNERAAALLSRDDLIGCAASECVPGYERAIADADGNDPGTVVTSGGGPRSIEVRVTSVTDVHARVTGRVVVLRDVTEQRNREQRLDVLNRVLRHNLRNEINVVYGYADHLVDERDPEAVEVIKQKASTIVELADKAREIERVLDAAQTDDEPIELVETLEYVLSDVEDRTGGTAELLAPDLEAVYCHRVVEAVVVNLVEAVVEYAGADAPTVEVTVTADADAISIDVSAEKSTIPEAELRAVKDGAETQLEHASGLRLWLVVWGTKQIGGSVAFDGDDDSIVTLRVNRREPPAGTAGSSDPTPVVDSTRGE